MPMVCLFIGKLSTNFQIQILRMHPVTSMETPCQTWLNSPRAPTRGSPTPMKMAWATRMKQSVIRSIQIRMMMDFLMVRRLNPAPSWLTPIRMVPRMPGKFKPVTTPPMTRALHLNGRVRSESTSARKADPTMDDGHRLTQMALSPRSTGTRPSSWRVPEFQAATRCDPETAPRLPLPYPEFLQTLPATQQQPPQASPLTAPEPAGLMTLLPPTYSMATFHRIQELRRPYRSTTSPPLS